MATPTTVAEVARYLLTWLEQREDGELIWSDVVPDMEQWPAGAQFLAVNRDRHIGFHPDVLRAFRALTGDWVVQVGWGGRVGWQLCDRAPRPWRTF